MNRVRVLLTKADLTLQSNIINVVGYIIYDILEIAGLLMPPRSLSLPSTDLMQRGVKLQHLRLIAQLRITKQISAAAAAMNISQPAASRLVTELERITQVPLYTRHPRGIELTEFGNQLAMRAQSILQGLQDAGRELAELSSGEAGIVNLGSVTGPAIEMVLPVLKRMRITHSQVETTVTVDISEVLAQDLLSYKTDFYIGRIPLNINQRLFHAAVIGEEPAALIVRDAHPLSRKPNISLSDCVPYDWVTQTHDGLLNRTIEDYMISSGLMLPGRILRTSSILLTLATVTETNSIAVISRSVAEMFGGENGIGRPISILPVAQDLSVSAYAIVKLIDSVLSPAAQTFYDYLIEHIKRAPNST